jgi:DNA polymerase epsilon subunit 1
VIPMGPEDVLRKGSGTLCEALLMAEAFRSNVVCPNKHQDPLLPFHNGHLLESETYVGGHVECLETGVYRSDIPERFSLKPAALQGLIDNVDRDLTFAVEVEHGVSRADIENYDSVRGAIIEGLEMLRDAPLRLEEPRILHLDVAAMYPNIILSNRLQPSAVVDRAECAACVFNTPESDCKRPLKWAWRGDTTPATRAEYSFLRNHISHELVDGTPFLQLPPQEQAKHLKERVNTYARKVYRKTKVTVEEERVDTVCMRENAFYINTVRAFRDRRYDYKMAVKRWKKERDKATDAVAKKIASDKAALFDSLQTAHKCILNSFYGYVMRKGARWRSMEMAGIVTYTGAQLITQARELIEQVCGGSTGRLHWSTP